MYKLKEVGRVSGRIFRQSCSRGRTCNFPLHLTQRAQLQTIGQRNASQCQLCGDINESIWAAMRNTKKLYTCTDAPSNSASRHLVSSTSEPVVCNKSTPSICREVPLSQNDTQRMNDICIRKSQAKFKRISPEFLKLLHPYDDYVDPAQREAQFARVVQVERAAAAVRAAYIAGGVPERHQHFRFDDMNDDDYLEEVSSEEDIELGPAKQEWKTMRESIKKMLRFRTFQAAKKRNRDSHKRPELTEDNNVFNARVSVFDTHETESAHIIQPVPDRTGTARYGLFQQTAVTTVQHPSMTVAPVVARYGAWPTKKEDPEVLEPLNYVPKLKLRKEKSTGFQEPSVARTQLDSNKGMAYYFAPYRLPDPNKPVHKRVYMAPKEKPLRKETAAQEQVLNRREIIKRKQLNVDPSANTGPEYILGSCDEDIALKRKKK